MRLINIFLIVVMPMLISNCSRSNKNAKEVKSVRYDTWYSVDKNDHSYSVRVYDSNDNHIESLEYDDKNKLIKSIKNEKWGWFSSKFLDSVKEIHEMWNPDSTKYRNDYVLNREYTIRLNGDTVCRSSCYYRIIGLSKSINSVQNYEYSVFIPCHGFSDDEGISYESSVKLTNKSNVFRVYEVSTPSNIIKYKFGNLPKGKYFLCGIIYIYKRIDKNQLIFRNLYLDTEFMVD